jgi:two-component system chemotaxis response regulator CheY
MPKSKVKILIVDDENTAKHLMRHHLFSLGFSNVIEACDGEDAIRILDKEKVDLIIADWNMPKKNGIEFFKSLQENDSLKMIPFLMTTVEGEKEKVTQAIQAGIRNYIVNPVYAETLNAKISQMLHLD